MTGRFTLVVNGPAYRVLALTLVAIAVLPTAWSWTSHIVRTGSMEPSISPGDLHQAAQHRPGRGPLRREVTAQALCSEGGRVTVS